MLRIIQKPTNPIFRYTLKDPLFLPFSLKEGIWLEYWENEIINFQFNIFNGVVSIVDNLFSSMFNEEYMKIFFNSVVSWGELKKWLENDVKFEVLHTLNSEDESITEIWKYDYKLDFWNSQNNSLKESLKDSLLKYYHEFLVQDAKIIRSLPYYCGMGIQLYGPDLTTFDEKLYWFNLCLLKYLTVLKMQ